MLLFKLCKFPILKDDQRQDLVFDFWLASTLLEQSTLSAVVKYKYSSSFSELDDVGTTS